MFTGNTLFIINVDFTNHKTWTLSRNAVYVDAITSVKGEEEIIFPAGTKCLIEKVELKGKVYVVTMTINIYWNWEKLNRNNLHFIYLIVC